MMMRDAEMALMMSALSERKDESERYAAEERHERVTLRDDTR